MAAGGIGRMSTWRRLVSWVAIYAFVLQSIFVGMAGFAAAAPDGIAGFEICQHSPGGADSGGGLPAQHPLDQAHCKLCLSITHAIATVPRAVPRVVFDVAVVLPLPAADNDLPSPPELFYEHPRGPPYAA